MLVADRTVLGDVSLFFDTHTQTHTHTHTHKHLREWWHGARVMELKPRFCVENWEKVLELVRLAFTGEIPEAFCHGILVLIPKGASGQYRGIALLEIVYKLVSSIINRRLASTVKFHDAVHGFRAGRGTGTAIIEAKLRMQLAQRSTKPYYMVFLDLKKAYDTLDRHRTLQILEGYGVGANLRKFLSMIWEGDTMIPKQSGYFGKAFKASRGVRQGDIVSPMIFNIVLDAVIREWEVQMGENNVDTQFYADDGLLSGNDEKEIQRALDLMTDGFARVGLKMNAQKTEALIMTGGKVYGPQSDQAYARRMGGEGMSYREKSTEKAICDRCGEHVARQYLTKHQQTAKCGKASKEARVAAATGEETATEDEPRSSDEEEEPKTYRVSMADGNKAEQLCPVEGCDYAGKSRFEMRRHFRSRHLKDTIIVEEEGQLPRCGKCGIFQKSVGLKHQASVDCKRYTESRERRADVKVQKVANEVVFMINERPIKCVKEFKYLGRILDNKDDDRPAINRNLNRARGKWGSIGRILSKENAKPQAMASFYKAIVQSVLLYGSESWVLNKRMLLSLESFHRRCARFITGRHIKENADGTWTYPDSKTTLSQAGMQPIDEYIRRRVLTVMDYSKERLIYKQCIESKPLASNGNQLVWWKYNIRTDA